MKETKRQIELFGGPEGAPWSEFPNAVRERRASVSRMGVAFVDVGSGEPVVFVHGALGDYRTWLPQVNMLSGRFRAVSYSRRAHFPHSRDEGGAVYSRATHAADLAALIDELGLGASHLVGHSYGGSVVAILAAARPDLVRSLVLAEPGLFAFADDQESAASLEALRSAFGDVVRELDAGDVLRALVLYSEAVRGAGVPNAMSDSARAVLVDNVHTLRPTIERFFETATFGREDAQRLEAPVLVVVGELSPLLYRRMATRLAELLPNVGMKTLEGASHGLQLERPAAFGALLLEFFASQARSRSPSPPAGLA